MNIYIFISFFSLIALLIIHEFSHFWVAKKFKVPVEEFGVGYPPRIFGKKFKGTLYSLNFLPFGAFVKIKDEDLEKKPIYQRALIIAAGILSFFVISAILISVVMMLGFPEQISDDEKVSDANIMVVGVVPNSPANISGIKSGDIILKVQDNNFNSKEINKVKELQEFTQEYKGEKIILTIKREKQIFDVSLVPRFSPPKNEGPLGIALARVAIKKYPIFKAFIEGTKSTGKITLAIFQGFSQMIFGVFKKESFEGELVGPVGIFKIFLESSRLGITYFLQIVALISLHVAFFNALPLPPVDGGKLLFLGIEKIRGKALNKKIEESLNSVFFIILLFLMLLVTVKDISKFFE